MKQFLQHLVLLALLFTDISGTATYGTDYTVSCPNSQPITTGFNGTKGTISILKNATQAVLRTRPKPDNVLEGDVTVTISLLEGGDYLLGSTISKSVTINNDDLVPPIIATDGPTAICNGGSVTLSTSNNKTIIVNGKCQALPPGQ